MLASISSGFPLNVTFFFFLMSGEFAQFGVASRNSLVSPYNLLDYRPGAKACYQGVDASQPANSFCSGLPPRNSVTIKIADIIPILLQFIYGSLACILGLAPCDLSIKATDCELL